MSETGVTRCQKCGGALSDLQGGRWLCRVNPTGARGVWECRPSCSYAHGDQAEAQLGALAGEEAEDE